ncbi:hypothetical protein P1X14_16580 [Sphingomonas sp. AOB5]|uniref:hypothetical protein n=1 Tax=Sphingomonas sp. AOB5 TaxID=3034017 RepID=UPI0023F6D29B|nr:hypothetical protein [Sphingomonas sp. AOB5]MDF7776875.1 hypothetical protein [Sphingomonas sp. AOB5]
MSRGEIRIVSQRSPYLRAGLGWPTREPVVVDIRELDGARLLELVRDPVLTVTAGAEDGSFHPFPQLADNVDAAACQLMINAFVAEFGPLPDSAPPIASEPTPAEPDPDVAVVMGRLKELGFDTVGQALDQLQSFAGQVREQASTISTQGARLDMVAAAASERGHPSIENLFEVYDRIREALGKIIALGNQAGSDGVSLDDVTVVGWVVDRMAQLAGSNALMTANRVRITALEAEIEKLKTAKAAPKPKAAPKN